MSGTATSKTSSPTKPTASKRTAHGRRFTAEQKQHALLLVASGVDKVEVARVIGTTSKSVREWERRALASGTMPAVPGAINDDAQPARGRAAMSAVAPTDADAVAAKEAETSGADIDQSTEPESSAGVETMPNAPNRRTLDAKQRSPYAPKDPGQGLGNREVAAILELKQRHPSYGPAQLRAQLKRFKGWRISNRAIARVLKQHGYELVHRGSRPQGPEPIRFEAPRRNALWQMDFASMRVGGEKLHLLVVIDDFSRFAVGHTLTENGDGSVVVDVLQRAVARHGKPEAVRSDRGGAFTGGAVPKWLEAELIDHIIGRSYHPQGGGKVESVIGTVRRELWDIEHFVDRTHAERRVNDFIEHYNHRRAHMGIDGLTPADRFFGRADTVLAKLDELSRKRNGALDQLAPHTTPFEEVLGMPSGAPMEVVRLMIVGGQMELRLCGARVCLGEVES